MKNVTISMDDDLAQRTRVAAARVGKSVSKFMAEAAREKIEAEERTASELGRNRQLEALERIFAGPKWDVTENGRMPTAEERNARGWQRDIR
jgi:plasmid stability protein